MTYWHIAISHDVCIVNNENKYYNCASVPRAFMSVRSAVYHFYVVCLAAFGMVWAGGSSFDRHFESTRFNLSTGIISSGVKLVRQRVA